MQGWSGPCPAAVRLSGPKMRDVATTEDPPGIENGTDEWRRELPTLLASFDALGERLPAELREELANLERRLHDA